MCCIMLAGLWPDSSGETYQCGSDFLLIIQFSLLMLGEQVYDPDHHSLQPLIDRLFYTCTAFKRKQEPLEY